VENDHSCGELARNFFMIAMIPT